MINSCDNDIQKCGCYCHNQYDMQVRKDKFCTACMCTNNFCEDNMKVLFKHRKNIVFHGLEKPDPELVDTESTNYQLQELREICKNIIKREQESHVAVARWMDEAETQKKFLHNKVIELEKLITERAVENRRIIIDRIVELERQAGYQFTPGDYKEKCNIELDANPNPLLMPFDEAVLALKQGNCIGRDHSKILISPAVHGRNYRLTLADLTANDWRIFR